MMLSRTLSRFVKQVILMSNNTIVSRQGSLCRHVSLYLIPTLDVSTYMYVHTYIHSLRLFSN